MPRRDEPLDLPDDDNDRPRRRPARAAGSLGGQLTVKYAGLPVWAWLGGAVAGAAALTVLAVVLALVAADAGRRGRGGADGRDAGGRGAGKGEPAEVPDGPPVEAADLFKEFADNGAEATAKYGGKRLRVRMRVDETSQHDDTLTLTHRTGGRLSPRVKAQVPVADAGRAKSGSVVVVGTIDWHDSQDVMLKGRVEPPSP